MKKFYRFAAPVILGFGPMMAFAGAGNSWFEGYKPVIVRPPVQQPVGVPEPATLGLLGLGVVAAAAAARRKKK